MRHQNIGTGTPFAFGDGKGRTTWILANPLERILAALLNCVFSAIAFIPLGMAIYDNILTKMEINFKTLTERLMDYIIQVVPISDMGKVGLVVFIIYALLQIWLMTNGGQSLGKKIMGIQVITLDGEAAGFFHAVLLRKFVYNLLCIAAIGIVVTGFKINENFSSFHLLWIPYLICLGMLTDESDNCRTLQDKLAGTAVVKKQAIVHEH